MTDLDPYRTPGSPYEHEEPFVIALVESGKQFDWKQSKPLRALWLPEDFFLAFHRAGVDLKLPLLAKLNNLYAQYRFGSSELAPLSNEFAGISGQFSAPLSEAALLASSFLAEGASAHDKVDAIIEGP